MPSRESVESVPIGVLNIISYCSAIAKALPSREQPISLLSDSTSSPQNMADAHTLFLAEKALPSTIASTLPSTARVLKL